MKSSWRGQKIFCQQKILSGSPRVGTDMRWHSKDVCACVCVFPFLLLLAGNYIKGALFQGPSPLNVIKHNLLSVVASCVSFFWGQPAPLRSSAASLPFCPDSSSNQSSKHDMLMARNSLDIIISCILNLPNNCSFIKRRSPKHLLTSRWSRAAIGKRGMQCFM